MVKKRKMCFEVSFMASLNTFSEFVFNYSDSRYNWHTIGIFHNTKTTVGIVNPSNQSM